MFRPDNSRSAASSRGIAVVRLFSVSAVLTGLVFASSIIAGDANLQSRLLLTVPLFISILTICLALELPGDRTFLILVGIYNTIFLLLPTMYHLSMNSFPFYAATYSTDTIEEGIGIVVIFELFFIGAYLHSNRNVVPHANSSPMLITYSLQNACGVVIILLLLVTTAIFIAGPHTFLARRIEVLFENSPVNMLVVFTGRYAGYFCFVTATLILAKGRELGRVRCWGLWSLALAAYVLTNNPMNVPRYILFGSLISFACIFADTRLQIFKIALCASICVGITTLFPAISIISRGNVDPLSYFAAGGPLYYLANSRDLDAFQSLLNTYLMVQSQGLSHGWHLLSDALAFIPRYLWTSKAHGTGVDAALFVGYRFVNVSGPLPAEFFVDFGWLGTALGGALVGKVCSSLERLINRAKECGDRFLLLVPATAAGFVIIIMRGSLEGVAAQVLWAISIAWMVSVACRVRISGGSVSGPERMGGRV